MSNLWYLFAAYAFVWAAVFAYVYTIAQRQHALEQSIKALRETLEREQK
jgi:CcmD family protein